MAVSAIQTDRILEILDLTDQEQTRFLFKSALHFDRTNLSHEDADQVFKFLSTVDKLMLRLAMCYICAKEAQNQDEASQLAGYLSGMWDDVLLMINSPTTETITHTLTHEQHEDIRKLVSRLEFTKAHITNTSDTNRRVKRPKTDCEIVTSNKFQVLQDPTVPGGGDPVPGTSGATAPDSAPATDSSEVPSTSAAAGSEAMDTTVMAEPTLLPPKIKVEPIFVSVPGSWIEFVKLINTSVLQTPVNVKLSGEFIKVPPQSIEDYRRLTNFLIEKQIKFHALQPKEERPVKVLLKGLKADTPINDIAAELIDFGLDPMHIHCLRDRKNENRPMPLFLVTLHRHVGWEKVYELTHIHHMAVHVKAFHSRAIKQCYRCQGFGHASQTCYQNPRCLKCAGAHHTRECVKPRSQPALCCNCKGPHPANYSGCAANPRNIKPKPPIPPRRGNTRISDRQVHIDAPLPADPAWQRPNAAVLQPFPAVRSDYPVLPARGVETAPTDTENPQPQLTRRQAAAERRAAAEEQNKQRIRSTQQQHSQILQDHAVPTTGGGLSEVFSVIKMITDLIDLPALLNILREVVQKLKTTKDPIDQAFVLLQAWNSITEQHKQN